MTRIRTIPMTKDAYDLFHSGTLAFARAERVGLRIDVAYCLAQQKKLSAKIVHLKDKVNHSKFGQHWKRIYGAKYNFNSDYQIAHILYGIKKIKPVKLTDSGKGSTDEEALSALGIPELNLVIKVRKLIKVRDTYLGAYVREQVNGVVHPSFNLHLVGTFRSSSDSPNFQNIPKRDEEARKITRSAIFPRKGCQFIGLDFSGIEVRMACIYTEDPQLIQDTIQGDMHRDMAIELYMLDSLDKHHAGEGNLRQGGKNGFVFPEFYGDYYGNCAPNLLKWAGKAYLKDGTPALVHLEKKGLVKLNRAGGVQNSAKFIEHVKKIEDYFWNVRYKIYTRWKNRSWKNYQKNGYVDMFTGFRCSGLMNKKEVTNYPFQGTAFHCLLKVFIEVDKLAYSKNWNSFPVFQVHDDMTVDTHPTEFDMVGKEMHRIATEELAQQWSWINIPLKVEMEKGEVDQSLFEKKFYVLP